MCVIVVKPERADIQQEIVEKCWVSNPDGAGLAYTDRHFVVVKKGISSVEELIQELASLKKKLVVLHFRLASAGKPTLKLTHPFMVGEQPASLCFKTSKPVLFHNGHIGNMPYTDQISDSLILSLMLSVLEPKDRIKLLTQYAYMGNRFVLLMPSEMHMIGQFVEHDGLMFSNLNWLEYDNSVGTHCDQFLFDEFGSQCIFCGRIFTYLEDSICEDCLADIGGRKNA